MLNQRSHSYALPDVFTRLSRCIDIAADLDIPASGKFRSQKSDTYAKRDASRGFTGINANFTLVTTRSILMVTSYYGQTPASRRSSRYHVSFDTLFASGDWINGFAAFFAGGRVETTGTHRSRAATRAGLAFPARRQLRTTDTAVVL